MEERKNLNKEIRLRETERRERIEVKRDGWLKVMRRYFLWKREKVRIKNTKNTNNTFVGIILLLKHHCSKFQIY